MAASERLGLSWRRQLDLGDGELRDLPGHRRALVEAIRAARPKVLVGPSPVDPHPDHRSAAALVEAAWFLSGVGGYGRDLGPAFRPPRRLQMVVRPGRRAHLLVPIDDVWERKLAAVRCYESQFAPAASHRLGLPDPLEELGLIARTFGALAGCGHAEGFDAPDGWTTRGIVDD